MTASSLFRPRLLTSPQPPKVATWADGAVTLSHRELGPTALDMEATLAGTQAATAQGTWAIAANQVTMHYGNGRQRVPILHSIDFQVRQGNIQFLMGPSGSGKTTLLSILAGILTPTGGGVELLGCPITNLSRDRLAKFRLANVGFVFQGFNLFPALTAQENVELALKLKGVNRRLLAEKAEYLLDRVGLGHRRHNRPRDLSGGEKQRVAIARALAEQPPLILADEPTAALDAKSGRGVVEMLRSLAKEDGATVLIVTHDPRILDLADRVDHLEDGHLQSQAA